MGKETDIDSMITEERAFAIEVGRRLRAERLDAGMSHWLRFMGYLYME